MKYRVELLPCLPLLLLIAVGCGGPYLKKSDAFTASSETRRALLTTAVVDANACKSGVRTKAGSMGDQCGGGLASFLQAGQLDEFGEIMIARSASFLAGQGVELYIDPPHAKKLNALKDSESRANFEQFAGGLWSSPDTSDTRIWGRPPMALYRHLFKKLNTSEPNEAFVFIDGRISKKSAWLGFWKKPRVEIDIGVYDENGDPLLQSRTVGYGKGQFLFINQSADNLELAMKRGLDDLAERTGEDVQPTRVAAAPAVAEQPGEAVGDAAEAGTADGAVDDGASNETGAETTDGAPTTAASSAGQKPFDPNAPPPKSLTDRPSSDPKPADPNAAPPKSLADRPSDEPAPADPNSAPPKSLADTPGGEPEPAATTADRDEQRNRDDAGAARQRIGGGVLLGFGGDALPVYTAEQKELLPNNFETPTFKLETSAGGFLQYEFLPIPEFAVGVRGEFYGWITEGESFNEQKRHKVLNLDPMIRGRVPIRSSVLYASARIGPSITIPSNDEGDEQGLTGLSWNYGLLGGIEILGNSAAPSVFVEAGYTSQQVRYGLVDPLPGEESTVRLRFWQVGFNIGVTYGL